MTLLDGELDRRQRVLDLVRQPLRHLLPGADPLQVLDARPRLLHLAQHPVEHARELRQLVGPGTGTRTSRLPRRPGDRVRKSVDAPRDAAGQEKPEGHRGHTVMPSSTANASKYPA